MRLENDDVLNECLQAEMKKIPWIFRCKKGQFTIFTILLGVWLLVDLFIAALPSEQPEIVWIKTATINYPFALPLEEVKTFTLMNIILLILLFWLETCDLLSRAAFKRASIKAAEINQHNKEVERWQELKEKQRLEKAMKEANIDLKKLAPKPRYCSKCGFLMPDDPAEVKCLTCGTIYEEKEN